MKTEYEPFDVAADYLMSEERIAGYLSAAAEDEDPNVLLLALCDAAKARGMMEVAKAAGLNRESLYKALKPGAHPRYETVHAVLRALGVKLAMSARAADAGDEARRAKEAAEIPEFLRAREQLSALVTDHVALFGADKSPTAQAEKNAALSIDAREAYVARRKAYEAEQSEIRRQAGQVAIWLERSPDDAETFTRDHQAELYKVLSPVLRDKRVDAEFLALDAADAVSGYTGQLIITLAAIPAITKVLVAWIQRQPGRKIRVEFHQSGKVKTVEAQTEEQILSLARALGQEARTEVPKAKRDKPGRAARG